MIIIKTSKGDIKLKLNPEAAPETVKNFHRYIDEGFYKDTIFHRVIPGFMIQGGGFDTDRQPKSFHEPIKNEANNGLGNKRGTIAMARRAAADSAASQFFINLVDNDFLNYRAPIDQYFGYCVFGEVVEGMDVVDEIAKVKTTRIKLLADVPVENVVVYDIVKED